MWKSTKKILKIGKMKQPCYRIVMHQIIIRTVVIYTVVIRPMVINIHGGRPKNVPPQAKTYPAGHRGYRATPCG